MKKFWSAYPIVDDEVQIKKAKESLSEDDYKQYLINCIMNVEFPVFFIVDDEKENDETGACPEGWEALGEHKYGPLELEDGGNNYVLARQDLLDLGMIESECELEF